MPAPFCGSALSLKLPGPSEVMYTSNQRNHKTPLCPTSGPFSWLLVSSASLQ